MNTLSQPTTNFIRRGFTLIEILIVVVILGILAAIVVPQFVNAADEANDAAMRSQLQTLRGQCELFYAKTGASPDFTAGDWDDLVTGDYILAAPKNPYNGLSFVGSSAAATNGWYWALKSGSTTTFMLYGVNASGDQFVE